MLRQQLRVIDLLIDSLVDIYLNSVSVNAMLINSYRYADPA